MFRFSRIFFFPHHKISSLSQLQRVDLCHPKTTFIFIFQLLVFTDNSEERGRVELADYHAAFI